MNILIYEHLSAGGGPEDGLSPELIGEGVAMLKAALTDYKAATGERVSTILDRSVVDCFTDFSDINTMSGDGMPDFEIAVKECDATLVIAPETGEVLEQLTRVVVSHGKINLGSDPEAIKITGDKLAFAHLMERVGIAHPLTFLITDDFKAEEVFENRWVSKPVDGAGSEEVIIHNRGDNCSFSADAPMLAQEYIEGDTMSLSVVSGEKETLILSVNRQTFDTCSDLKYLGGVVTDKEPDVRLKEMVTKIAEKVPGLRGFWGLDYIQTDFGPVVIELNPRLTSSYCALGAALGVNPAKIVLASVMGAALPDSFHRKEIEFTLSGVAI